MQPNKRHILKNIEAQTYDCAVAHIKWLNHNYCAHPRPREHEE